jgi:hypothetical protein
VVLHQCPQQPTRTDSVAQAALWCRQRSQKLGSDSTNGNGTASAVPLRARFDNPRRRSGNRGRVAYPFAWILICVIYADGAPSSAALRAGACIFLPRLLAMLPTQLLSLHANPVAHAFVVPAPSAPLRTGSSQSARRTVHPQL